DRRDLAGELAAPELHHDPVDRAEFVNVDAHAHLLFRRGAALCTACAVRPKPAYRFSSGRHHRPTIRVLAYGELPSSGRDETPNAVTCCPPGGPPPFPHASYRPP